MKVNNRIVTTVPPPYRMLADRLANEQGVTPSKIYKQAIVDGLKERYSEDCEALPEVWKKHQKQVISSGVDTDYYQSSVSKDLLDEEDDED